MLFTHLTTQAVVFGFILTTCTPALHGSQNQACPSSATSGAALSNLLQQPPVVPPFMLIRLLRELRQLIPAAIQEHASQEPTTVNQERLRACIQQPMAHGLRLWLTERKKQEKIPSCMETTEIDQESTINPLIEQEWITAQKKMDIAEEQRLPISLIRSKQNLPNGTCVASAEVCLDRIFINQTNHALQNLDTLRYILYHEAAHLKNQDPIVQELYGSSFRMEIRGTIDEVGSCSKEEFDQLGRFCEKRADQAAYRTLACYLCVRSVSNYLHETLKHPEYQRHGYLGEADVEAIAHELQETNQLCPTHKEQKKTTNPTPPAKKQCQNCCVLL